MKLLTQYLQHFEYFEYFERLEDFQALKTRQGLQAELGARRKFQVSFQRGYMGTVYGIIIWSVGSTSLGAVIYVWKLQLPAVKRRKELLNVIAAFRT